jgi:RNA polymerase sigma factor (sigma-70 family)
MADCKRMPAVPTPEDDDAPLMAAFAGGDVRAFEQLYERHHLALYRFVRRLLGPALAAQADEVFQDTWLRVVQARAQWRPQGARFRTWLFTLAHHRAIDLLRRGGREIALPDDGDDGAAPFEPSGVAWQHWPTPAQSQDDQAFWRRAGQRLLECLEQLPDGQKAAFLLHHEDGASVAEVAQVLALGFETAKSRLRYAMTRLRSCMGAHLDDAGLGRA